MDIKEMQQMIESFKRKVRELVSQVNAENKEIKRINKNCFIINMSTSSKHNIWSPEFYDFEYQLRAIEKALCSRSIEEYPGFLRKILQDGYFVPSNTPYGSRIIFHPVLLKRLKEALNEHVVEEVRETSKRNY